MTTQWLWGLFSRTVPQVEHVSCTTRLGELEERVRSLELDGAERQLRVLDVAEKLAERLKDRERKREPALPAPTRAPRPWELKRGGNGGV